MSANVYVTNKNDFVHQDRYDSVDYVFPPGEPVVVPLDAATHMFGMGLADKSEILLRLGWATRYDPKTKNLAEDPDGVEKLKRFVFEEAVMVRASQRQSEHAVDPELAALA
jgi:hypothetical protein